MLLASVHLTSSTAQRKPLLSGLVLTLLLSARCSTGSSLWDYDEDGTADGEDCQPQDPEIHPGAEDTLGDGIDQDCDGMDGDAEDRDGDGVGNNADAFPFDNTETADSDGDGVGDNAQAANEGGEPAVPDEEPDDGGLLPGFSGATSLVSMLGAAILIAGRRKD